VIPVASVLISVVATVDACADRADEYEAVEARMGAVGQPLGLVGQIYNGEFSGFQFSWRLGY
jgi:hypothetical protein